jgi:hypothetical protein
MTTQIKELNEPRTFNNGLSKLGDIFSETQ